jgi:hypothetical protein
MPGTLILLVRNSELAVPLFCVEEFDVYASSVFTCAWSFKLLTDKFFDFSNLIQMWGFFICFKLSIIKNNQSWMSNSCSRKF